MSDSDQIKGSGTAIEHYYITDAEDMKFIVIPKGTLLYNAVHVPLLKEAKTDEEVYKSIFQEWMGIFPFKYSIKVDDDIMEITFCLDQMNQKFFYSNPAGGPTLLKINQNVFNHISVYETVRDMKLAILMSPSNQHRLVSYHPEKVTCDRIEASACKCSVVNGACPHAQHFDPCLKPAFLNRNKCDGHFTIRSVKDSYAFRMQSFQRYFNNFGDLKGPIDKFVRYHNRLLFDYGRSKDIRPPELPTYPNETVYLGFPEIVIHIFGTNWFGSHDQLERTFSVKLPANHTIQDRADAFSTFLKSYNTSKRDHVSFDNGSNKATSPMKLIGYANENEYYNILTKDTIKLPEAYKKIGSTYKMYLNLLNAYYKGSLKYYFDTRTGFLINDRGPSIKLRGGKTFREACLYYGDKASDALTRSAISRKEVDNKFWPPNSRLIDNFMTQQTSKTRRRTISRKKSSPKKTRRVNNILEK